MLGATTSSDVEGTGLTKIPQTPEERIDVLAARRLKKMARSSHSFVRGDTIEHYRWLRELDPQLPDGPAIWICGDCHVENFGAVSDGDGDVKVQVRDFDQCVIGNPTLDLIRLILSLASAARGFDLPGVATARMINKIFEGYDAGIASCDFPERSGPEADVVTSTRHAAADRKWKALSKDRLDGEKVELPLDKHFWPLTDAEHDGIRTLIEDQCMRHVFTGSGESTGDVDLDLLDAAYWRRGCSSLGLLRYAAMVRVTDDDGERLSLIDIKQAVPSVAPSAEGAVIPSDPGERVVTGARAMSPYLGLRMGHGTLMGKSVFVREHSPKDLKIEIEDLSEKKAKKTAFHLAYVVGEGHGRQMDKASRLTWRAEMVRSQRSNKAAPSWLWEAVVPLLMRHEEAYLRYCRHYDMPTSTPPDELAHELLTLD